MLENGCTALDVLETTTTIAWLGAVDAGNEMHYDTSMRQPKSGLCVTALQQYCSSSTINRVLLIVRRSRLLRAYSRINHHLPFTPTLALATFTERLQALMRDRQTRDEYPELIRLINMNRKAQKFVWPAQDMSSATQVRYSTMILCICTLCY